MQNTSLNTLNANLKLVLNLPHMGDFEQLHTWGGGHKFFKYVPLMLMDEIFRDDVSLQNEAVCKKLEP